MNRFQKKILTIAAGLLNIGLALSAAAVATYAWFAMEAVNINVTDKAATITAQDPGDQMQYEIYKYDDNLKAGKLFTNPSDFTLPDYDKYITEKNVYANAIVRAEITLNEPLLTSNYEFSIDITRLASDFLNDGKIGRYTSNVVQFKATLTKFQEVGQSTYTTNTASHNNIDETSAATKYATASEYFRNRSTPTTFVPIRYYDNGTALVTRGDDANKRTISIIPPIDSGYEINKVVMYLECSYHDTLVDKYVETNTSEGSVKYSLNGDISSINFSKKEKVLGTSHATGKYIRVESEDQGLQNGQMIVSRDAGSNVAKVFKGSTANQNSSLPTGVSADNNVVDWKYNTLPSNEPKSIESTDEIDENSLYFEKTHGTLLSKPGYFIGNHETANNKYGIETSNTYSSNFDNNITFDNTGNANIYGSGNTYKLRYNSENNRYNYYKTDYQKVELYRYTENVAEMPTLVSIEITHAATKTAFYVGQKFSVPGLVVTATYSDNSTANVTGACKFTSSTAPTTVVPGTTAFTNSHITNSKTIYVNYSEGGVTIADNNRPSYTISISADSIDHLVVAHAMNNIYYYVGDTFDSTGLQINAVYASGTIAENVAVTLSTPTMSSAGSQNITASYETVSNFAVGTIYIRDKALSIDTASKTIEVGDDPFTINVTHNQAVTITQTSDDGGAVSLSSASISYSKSDKTTQIDAITVTPTTKGTVTITFSSSGCADVTCEVSIDGPDYTLDGTTKKPYTSTSSSNTSTTTQTVDSITYQNYGGYIYSNGGIDYMSINRSINGYLQNNTAYSSPIRKIVITMREDNFSKITLYKGNSAGAETTSISPTIDGAVATYDFGSTHNYFKLKLTTTGTYVNMVGIKIYLGEPVPTVTLSQDTLSLAKNSTDNTTVSVTTSNFSGTPTFTVARTSGSDVFSTGSVSNNKLSITTKNTAGSAVVTVTATYGGESASATITIKSCYTVTYAANGGTGSMSPVLVETGGSHTLLANGFTAPSGKSFGGWTVGGVTRAVGYTITNITSDITATAIWSSSSSTLTFNTSATNFGYSSGTLSNATMTVGGVTLTASSITGKTNSPARIQLPKSGTITSTQISGNISQIVVYDCAHTGSSSDGGFTIQCSSNGSSWTTVYTVSNMSPAQGTVTASGISSGYKYFRIVNGSKRVLQLSKIVVTY